MHTWPMIKKEMVGTTVRKTEETKSIIAPAMMSARAPNLSVRSPTLKARNTGREDATPTTSPTINGEPPSATVNNGTNGLVTYPEKEKKKLIVLRVHPADLGAACFKTDEWPNYLATDGRSSARTSSSASAIASMSAAP